jgi:hypothetical protein
MAHLQSMMTLIIRYSRPKTSAATWTQSLPIFVTASISFGSIYDDTVYLCGLKPA